MKTVFYILIGSAIVLFLAIAVIFGPYVLRIQHFEASPANGYHADFYLYVSPESQRIARDVGQMTILVQPNK